MNAGTLNGGTRRSATAFRWSAAPIIDGEIVRRSGHTPRASAAKRPVTSRIGTAALVLAALLCTLALLAFAGVLSR